MAKIDERPIEKMRLTIELADNGIIVRNPYCEDDVTVAVDGKGYHREGYGYDIDFSDVYNLIGRKIYEWLTDVAFQEHDEYWLSTGAELEITATLTGRERG